MELITEGVGVGVTVGLIGVLTVGLGFGDGVTIVLGVVELPGIEFTPVELPPVLLGAGVEVVMGAGVEVVGAATPAGVVAPGVVLLEGVPVTEVVPE